MNVLVHRGPRAGFTLLEVMASVAILGLLLTVIFSSEAGAIKIAHRSRKTGVASLLVRCKMGEIEQQMAKEGFPALFASGSDECCEEAGIEGFSCDWTVNRIVLPDTMFTGEETDQALAQMPGSGSASNVTGTQAASPAQAAAATIGSMDMNDVISGNAGGAVEQLAAFALPLIYPVLKPVIEDQIRRATVTVKWREGSAEHSFDVVQYIVAEQPPLTPIENPDNNQTGAGQNLGAGSQQSGGR